MNKDLKSEIYSLVRNIFEYMDKSNFEIQYDEVTRIKINSGGYSTHFEDIPDYGISFYYNCHSYFESLDFSKLNDLFYKEYPFFKNYLKTRRQGGTLSPKRILEIIIIYLLSKQTSLNNLEMNLEIEIEEFSKFIETRKTKVREYHPILNLYNVEGIDNYILDKGVSIKRLTSDEINKFIEYKTTFEQITDDRFAIVVEYYEDIAFEESITLKEPEIVKKIPQILKNILYALNLTTRGSFAFNSVYIINPDYYARFSGISSSKSYLNYYPNTYHLTQEQFNNWITKYNLLHNNHYETFKLALNRLSEAERRINPTDSIIDSVIGLESVLLNDIGNEKTRGEMKYRFSLNYASLFSKEKRLEMKKFAGEIYDLRSSIVHGSKKIGTTYIIRGKQYSINRIAEEVNEMLRFTINFLLELPKENNFNKEGFWINRVLSLE